MTDVAVIHASVSALHRNNSGLTPSHGGMRLERPPPKPTLKRKVTALCKAWFDSLWYTLVVACTIVYVMFGNDVRLAVAPKSADPVFFALTCIALALFVVDMVVCSIVSRVRFVLDAGRWGGGVDDCRSGGGGGKGAAVAPGHFAGVPCLALHPPPPPGRSCTPRCTHSLPAPTRLPYLTCSRRWRRWLRVRVRPGVFT
jgi:hypothetical protein